MKTEVMILNSPITMKTQKLCSFQRPYLLKGTVSVISNDPSSKKEIFRFTKVPSKALSYQV